MSINKQQAGDGKPSPASPLRRWLSLGLGIVLIIMFISVVGNLERITGKSKVLDTLREKDINVGAWYWDYVPEVSDAMTLMRGAMGNWSDEEQNMEGREQKSEARSQESEVGNLMIRDGQ